MTHPNTTRDMNVADDDHGNWFANDSEVADTLWSHLRTCGLPTHGVPGVGMMRPALVDGTDYMARIFPPDSVSTTVTTDTVAAALATYPGVNLRLDHKPGFYVEITIADYRPTTAVA